MGKAQASSSPGGAKGKSTTGSSTQLMTPEQLARRIAQQAATGKAGEAIAWRDEIERLRQFGVKNPEQCVEQTAATNVAAGYDLESTTSTERRLIEVKSSTDGFSQGFFLSRNEWKTLEEAGDDAYIYLVSVTDVFNEDGRVIERIRNPIKRLKASAHCEPALFQVWPNGKRK